MTSEAAEQELITLIEDYHDYNPDHVAFVAQHPTAVEFCRQVSKGIPCVYQAEKALESCKARQWTPDYLIAAVSQDIDVAVTPDGRADSLCALPGSSTQERVFLQPANISMKIEQLLRILDGRQADETSVYYLQSQNSNLTSTALQELLEDLPQNFDFARPTLGAPEAINIWIGDDRSVTSAHRDPYENLYVVLRGQKTFTLWPPVNEVCMHAEMVRTGCYVYDKAADSFRVVMDDGYDQSESDNSSMIPWIPIDPQLSRELLNTQYPFYRYARPRTVTVSAGQMLFLPSGWYHHVAQACGTWDDGTKAPCIAVNYWYDMDYEGERYVTRQLIGRLSQLATQAR